MKWLCVYQVFVGGLLNQCSEDELFDFFAEKGSITDVMIPVDRCECVYVCVCVCACLCVCVCVCLCVLSISRLLLIGEREKKRCV